METAEILAAAGACAEAAEWARAHPSPADAWHKCERGDWLLWIAARRGVDRRKLAVAAAKCAATALRFVPDNEERPRIAIETALSWADGFATIDEVAEAAAAAYAAAFAGYSSRAVADAAYAAYAAAYAAYAAADVAAAAAAARVARAAAACDVKAECAKIVRSVIRLSDLNLHQ